MKRSTFLTWEQLRVGGLVVVAVVIVIVAILRLGDSVSLFSDRYHLVSYVPNANGLREGGSVLLAGQLVGTIEAIEFLPVDADTTRNLRIRMTIDRTLANQIREDSRARLRPLGLLGDKVVDISPGTPQFAVLDPGDVVPTGESVDYDLVLLQASGAVREVVGLTQELRTITGTVARGEGTLGALLTRRELYDELRQTLERSNQLLAGLQNPRGSVGQLLNDPALYNNLVQLTVSLDSLVTDLNRPDGTFGRLVRDDTLYETLVGAAVSADSVLELLVAGRGTAGQLLRDEDLYEALVAALAEVTVLLEDLRQNPRRYTPGLIRIF